MSRNKYVLLEKISGDLNAELLRGLLEAQGIPVVLSKEGYAKALGLNVGPLGEVEILVPEDKFTLARQVLVDYHAGVFARSEFPDNSTGYEDMEEFSENTDGLENDGKDT
ncbi:MAG: DUF2007 domain-containing protein [Anaerolineales bacterium]|nr:MAG: DUF2007 domain-containing protein [Anaerolineales bacterium]